MVGKTEPITQKDEERFTRIKELCGCLPCLLENNLNSYPEIHHVTDCGRRIGHQATYGNCPWHHRGVCWGQFSMKQMRDNFGPSFAVDRAAYQKRYGEEWLLLNVQNFVLSLHDKLPWQWYCTPPSVARQVQQYWKGLHEKDNAESGISGEGQVNSLREQREDSFGIPSKADSSKH